MSPRDDSDRIIRIGCSIVLAGLVSMAPLPSSAGDLEIEFQTGLTQDLFKELSREIGSAISYTALAPAEPLGLLGFDAGIEVTVVDVSESSDYWRAAVSDTSLPGSLILPKLHLQKGLPFGFDVGLAYTQAHRSNVASIGTELKWAYVRGGAVIPALAFRGTYARLLAVDDLTVESYSADISVSKGLAFVTPYIGLGQVWVKSEDQSGLGLDTETVSYSKGFIGAKLRLLLFSLAAEIEVGETARYSLRANLSF